MLKHGRWVPQAVMLGAGCRFRAWLRSGVCEAAQRRAASDTYRLWHAARRDGALWRGAGVPRGALAAGRGLRGFGDTHLTPSPLPQSIQDFHEDLFPDCAGMLPATGAQAWWAGDSQQVSVTQGGVPTSGIARGCHHSLPTALPTGR